jgi:hypothetical protein
MLQKYIATNKIPHLKIKFQIMLSHELNCKKLPLIPEKW